MPVLSEQRFAKRNDQGETNCRGPTYASIWGMRDAPAMDNAEPYDLVTVLSRLEDLRGMAHEIGRHSHDDLHVAPAADAERTGLFRKMLRRFWPGPAA